MTTRLQSDYGAHGQRPAAQYLQTLLTNSMVTRAYKLLAGAYRAERPRRSHTPARCTVSASPSTVSYTNEQDTHTSVCNQEIALTAHPEKQSFVSFPDFHEGGIVSEAAH